MTSCHNISKKIPLGYYAKWDFLFTIPILQRRAYIFRHELDFNAHFHTGGQPLQRAQRWACVSALQLADIRLSDSRALRKLLSFLAFKIASITENSGASASHSALNAGSFIWSFRKSLRFVIWNFPFWKDNLLYTF